MTEQKLPYYFSYVIIYAKSESYNHLLWETCIFIDKLSALKVIYYLYIMEQTQTLKFL